VSSSLEPIPDELQAECDALLAVRWPEFLNHRPAKRMMYDVEDIIKPDWEAKAGLAFMYAIDVAFAKFLIPFNLPKIWVPGYDSHDIKWLLPSSLGIEAAAEHLEELVLIENCYQAIGSRYGVFLHCFGLEDAVRLRLTLNIPTTDYDSPYIIGHA
jgi:hypothetical protein